MKAIGPVIARHLSHSRVPLFGLLCLLCLSACAHRPELSSPTVFDGNVQATQWVQLRQREQAFDFLCLIDISPAQLTLVATTPEGQKLFTAYWKDGQALQLDSPTWLSQRGVNPADIVSDMQIALWPSTALQASGWEVRDDPSGERRIVRWNGKTWADIRYHGARLRPETIEMIRGDSLYAVTIKTLEWETQ